MYSDIYKMERPSPLETKSSTPIYFSPYMLPWGHENPIYLIIGICSHNLDTILASPAASGNHPKVLWLFYILKIEGCNQ